jgi:DNA repair ATPase RecN
MKTPEELKEKMCHDSEEIKEMECIYDTQTEQKAYADYMKKIDDECEQMKERMEEKFKELDKLARRNHVTVEEIKEISEVMNAGDQCITENEEQLGTNQIVPSNINHSEERKRLKRTEKRRQKFRERKELHEEVRKYLKDPHMTNVRIQEFLKNLPPREEEPEEIQLFKLIREKDQREPLGEFTLRVKPSLNFLLSVSSFFSTMNSS